MIGNKYGNSSGIDINVEQITKARIQEKKLSTKRRYRKRDKNTKNGCVWMVR